MDAATTQTVDGAWAEYRRHRSQTRDARGEIIRTGEVGIFPLSRLRRDADLRARRRRFRRVKGKDGVLEVTDDLKVSVSKENAKVEESDKDFRPLRVGPYDSEKLEHSLRRVAELDDLDELEDWMREEERPTVKKVLEQRVKDVREENVRRRVRA